MDNGKFFGAVVLSSVTIGAAIVGGSLIQRSGVEATRYEMVASGSPNAVWRMDRKTGDIAVCGVAPNGDRLCRAIPQNWSDLGTAHPEPPPAQAE